MKRDVEERNYHFTIPWRTTGRLGLMRIFEIMREGLVCHIEVVSRIGGRKH